MPDVAWICLDCDFRSADNRDAWLHRTTLEANGTVERPNGHRVTTNDIYDQLDQQQAAA